MTEKLKRRGRPARVVEVVLNQEVLPSETSATIDPKQLAAELGAEITIVDAHGIGLYGRTNSYVNTKGKTYGEVFKSFKEMGV